MPINILMPALSPTMEKGNLAKWLKKEGDKIKSGDVLAEIETDKATMEVEAVDEGVVSRLLVDEGAQGVKVNTPIAVLDAVRKYETTGRANVLRGVHRLAEAATEAYDQARKRIARYLGVRAEEIVITSGTTASINLVARALGETSGMVKFLAHAKTDEILGVHIIGPRATELVSEAVMALRMEVTVEELIKTIHAHPTMAEAVAEAM